MIADRGSYGTPFGWWGPVWTDPTPRTAGDLVRDRVLTDEAVALLAALLGRRASIVVAAGPSGAGKTTLLTALLDFLPVETRRIYLRGCYESFSFLTETEPRSSMLLVNELSAHLPIYLWGPGVRRALAAVRAGYGLAATAHATTVEEFVYSLAGYPLRVPAVEIAAIDLLVLLDAWATAAGIRREVRTIAALSVADDRGIAVATIAERSGRGAPLRVDLAAAGPLYARLGGDPATLTGEVGVRTAIVDPSSAPMVTFEARRDGSASGG